MVGSGNCSLTISIAPCRFVSAPRSNMPAKKNNTFSSTAGPGGKGNRTIMGSGRPYLGKPTEFLNEQEFRDGFCLPNGVSVQLVEGDPMPTEKVGHNVIYFTNKQFNTGLRFLLPSLFKQFLHYTQIPPAYIHPNIVWMLMGHSILNMVFHLDLSLLEVLFIYTLKKGQKGHFQHVCPHPVSSVSDGPS